MYILTYLFRPKYIWNEFLKNVKTGESSIFPVSFKYKRNLKTELNLKNNVTGRINHCQMPLKTNPSLGFKPKAYRQCELLCRHFGD